ncbi:MAG: transposase, partial [Blastocatellia bacterium]
YKIVDPKLPHFVTCTVLHWIPVFTRPATVDIVLDCLRYLIAEEHRVYAYVILENHIHLVAQSNDLKRDMSRFKSYTAKRLIQYLDQQKVSQMSSPSDSRSAGCWATAFALPRDPSARRVD